MHHGCVRGCPGCLPTLASTSMPAFLVGGPLGVLAASSAAGCCFCVPPKLLWPRLVRSALSSVPVFLPAAKETAELQTIFPFLLQSRQIHIPQFVPYLVLIHGRSLRPSPFPFPSCPPRHRSLSRLRPLPYYSETVISRRSIHG